MSGRTADGATTIETTAFAGWEECLRLENGAVEAVVTTAVGPRIVSFGRPDGRNCCHLTDEAGTRPADGEWHCFGGHRCWHAPEVADRTARPDNDPVAVERGEDGVRLRQPVEPATGIRKSLSIRLVPGEPRAIVRHELRNEGAWPVELAPWAVTVLAPGGTAVLPAPPTGEGRQADRSVSLWPYTDLSDDRLRFRESAVRVDQGTGPPTKVGVDGHEGWGAYLRNGLALRKAFDYDPEGRYPDRGAALQAYTDGDMLELETLGPLRTVAPGEAATHVEEWTLLEGVSRATPVEALAPEGDRKATSLDEQ